MYEASIICTHLVTHAAHLWVSAYSSSEVLVVFQWNELPNCTLTAISCRMRYSVRQENPSFRYGYTWSMEFVAVEGWESDKGLKEASGSMKGNASLCQYIY